MTYPSASDYVAAVQNRGALLDPELHRATFTVDPIWQIPRPPAGNSAVVFQASVDGRLRGFRFFIRDDASSRERYNNLHAFLDHYGLTDCTATATWVDQAIEVKGRRWPMVTMQWIDGRTLDAYVDHLVQSGDRRGLAALAETWRSLVRRMQGVGFAHGDLQHGNVLVATDCTLRLVDFDGCWLPVASGPPPNETGHPNYQLPSRPWGPWMDTFPALLVYTALRGLSLQPGLWQAYGARENILFTKDDFSRPFETPVWSDLRALRDRSITYGLTRLSAACEAAGVLPATLEDVVDESARTRSPRPSAPGPGAFTASPLDPTRVWWTESSGGGRQVTPEPPGVPPHLTPPPQKTARLSEPGPVFAGAHSPGWYAAPRTTAPTGPHGPAVGGTQSRLGSVFGRGAPISPRTPPATQRVRRRRRVWPAAVLVFLVLLVLVVAVAWWTGSTSGG